MADYDEVIPPGKEGKINVKLVGRQLNPGRFSKSYSVVTNDPEQSRLVLYTNGTVQPVLQISKPLSITGFSTDELRDEMIVTVAIDQPVRITGFHWDKSERGGRDREILGNVVGVKISPLEQGKKYRVETWLKQPVPPRNYFSQIVLETDFKDMEHKQVAFNLNVMHEVQAHPNIVYMQELVVPEGTSKSFERTVAIVAARGDSLRILEVIPSDQTMTYSMREVKPGQSYQCRFQVRPPTQPGNYDATLTFRTNYTGYEEIVVPVRGMVRVTRDGQR